MKQKRRYSRAKKATAGQGTIFGEIEGLDELVDKPRVIESNGQKVVSLIIRETDEQVPGYVDKALEIARRLVPEVKSQDKPPWMSADWQANKRKKRAGVA
jgi:hypothetical protein